MRIFVIKDNQGNKYVYDELHDMWTGTNEEKVREIYLSISLLKGWSEKRLLEMTDMHKFLDDIFGQGSYTILQSKNVPAREGIIY